MARSIGHNTDTISHSVNESVSDPFPPVALGKIRHGSVRNPSWLWEESVTCGDWLLLLLVELVGGGSVINGAYPV